MVAVHIHKSSVDYNNQRIINHKGLAGMHTVCTCSLTIRRFCQDAVTGDFFVVTVKHLIDMAP